VSRSRDTSRPEFTYSHRSLKLEAVGEAASKRAFYVALVIAFGLYIIRPLALIASLIVLVWYAPDPSSLAPLLRKGLSYIHIVSSVSP
jgi:hypothetical protein